MQLEAIFFALATNFLMDSFCLCWTLRSWTRWTAEWRVTAARDLILARRVSSVVRVELSSASMRVRRALVWQCHSSSRIV